MSGRKSSLLGLRDNLSSAPVAPTRFTEAAANSSQAPTRQGRKQIAGFFSTEMSFAMRTTAMRNGQSLQAAMAEAFDDYLRKYGESPIGG